MISAEVSPGMAIISKPTEQTAVMASSFVKVKAPVLAAWIMPASSVTGIKAPERPPTWGRRPSRRPFFTASFSKARQAVVPWAPQVSNPISSNMYATESPMAG